MRKNAITKAIMVTIPAMFAASTMAATVTGNVGFRTIQDVSITETVAINYGTSIVPLAGNTCTVDGLGQTTATVAVAAGTLSGGGCSGTGTGGYFALSGENSASIKVTVNSSDLATFPDYQFTPAGNYAAIALGGNNGGAFDTYFPDTQTTLSLSAGGVGTLFVGGRLQILNDLSYDTSYTVTYDIDVTY
jgi:hypothetical protein